MSCEKFFMTEHERHYFIFTDGHINNARDLRIKIIPQKFFGWPSEAVKRYHRFINIIDVLQKYDFIFFFNANCKFCIPINVSILPMQKNSLLVVQHPGFYNKKQSEFPYERNQLSQAYIPYDHGKYYICSGINGGYADTYCTLIEELYKAAELDEKNGIIALWHDESHLNRYILDKEYKMLSPSYCYPENSKLPFKEIVRVRDKNLHGGHNYLRQISHEQNGLHTRVAQLRAKISWKQ
jgi:hypothetical protein